MRKKNLKVKGYVMIDTLIATIAIGDKYKERYSSLFFENHKKYAEYCGYDIKVITDYLDKKNQHTCFISLQKILVCSQEYSCNYNYIIYVDADILFNNITATPLHLLVKSEKIYIADEYTQPTRDIRLLINKRKKWEKSATDYYALAGLDLDTNSVLNTGLMIFQPRLHKDILEQIYFQTIKNGYNHPRGFHFEQAMIGYSLQKNHNWEILPNEWNAIWGLQKISPKNRITLMDFYAKNKAVHFAGNTDIDKIPSLISNYYGRR